MELNIELIKDKAFFIISGIPGSGKTKLANDLKKSLEKLKQKVVIYEDASHYMIIDSNEARSKLHKVIQSFTAYRHTDEKVIIVTQHYPRKLDFIFNGDESYRNNTAWLFTMLPDYLYNEFPITIPTWLRVIFYKKFMRSVKVRNRVTRPALVITKEIQNITRYHK